MEGGCRIPVAFHGFEWRPAKMFGLRQLNNSSEDIRPDDTGFDDKWRMAYTLTGHTNAKYTRSALLSAA